eukprot:scaffold20446_cov54-Phaeocystis_antarctica.AAC.3
MPDMTCVMCDAWQVLQDLSDKVHPYIVSLHHSFQDDAHLYLVMDFVGGGLPACAASAAFGTAQCIGRGGALALGCSWYSGEPPLSPPTRAAAPVMARVTAALREARSGCPRSGCAATAENRSSSQRHCAFAQPPEACMRFRIGGCPPNPEERLGEGSDASAAAVK